MINYIGDLSRADAELLRVFAEKADRILEFGVGASTQIFAAYARCGPVHSVETDPTWIEKTQRNLIRLDEAQPGAIKPVLFYLYESYRLSWGFDLIFIDGVDELRQDFALLTWAALEPGGAMLFHDTRRSIPHGDSPTTDLQNALAVVDRFALEVDRVLLNHADSNITIVRKRLVPLVLEDWNEVEGRALEQIGLA